MLVNGNTPAPCAALGLALLCCTAGCSFLFVTPHPAKNGSEPCTQSMAMPIVDGTVGGLAVGTALAASMQDSDAYTDSDTKLAAGLAVGTVFMASLIYGSVNIRACRAYNSRGYSGGADPDHEEQGAQEAADEYYDEYHWQLDDSPKAEEKQPPFGAKPQSRPKPESEANSESDPSNTESETSPKPESETQTESGSNDSESSPLDETP